MIAVTHPNILVINLYAKAKNEILMNATNSTNAKGESRVNAKKGMRIYVKYGARKNPRTSVTRGPRSVNLPFLKISMTCVENCS